MSLIRGTDITVAFGSVPVLQSVSFSIKAATRIALVGRNGEGKSTFLKLLAGELEADSGDLSQRNGLKTAYLPQAVPADIDGSVYSIVASGVSGVGELLAEFHLASQLMATDPRVANKMARLQDQLDARDGWSLGQRVEQTLTRMSLAADTPISSLSGGMKRRVLLAKAIVAQPDLLLLDEPTNHLDIGAIAWLEEYLRSLKCSVVFVTHDRSFLDDIAQHILELDRGVLTEWPSNYETYRIRKQQQLDVELEQNALLDKKLAQEETWIRQGIKARRTRNEGRVRALEALREQHRQRRNRSGSVKMSVNQADRSGKMVFEADAVNFAYAEQTIIRNFSIRVQRQDRLGIIGPNGCGKSTVVNLLLGKLKPSSGMIQHGTQLQIAYFDQLRTSLNIELSAAENVSGGRDNVQINGAPRHIMSYMQDFLFAPDRARAPINALSGGETNRLLLAKLFLKPSNVLVLDEPSNDLDIETLELLESLIGDYPGTVILISHDRQLLDNIVTRSLVYQGRGRFIDVVGGYGDFLRELAHSRHLVPIFGPPDNTQTSLPTDADSQLGVAKSAVKTSAKTSAADKKIKRSYRQQRELDELPDQINAIETELATLHSTISSADFYNDAQAAQQIIDNADSLQKRVEAAYKRWDDLENTT